MWVEEESGWFWHAGDYPPGWENRVKVTNIFVPVKKSSAKYKSVKKGDDSSEACSNIVPFDSVLPTIGNIVLEGSSPHSSRTRSSKRLVADKSKPTAPQPFANAPPSSRT